MHRDPLPDEIVLTREEATIVLFALDDAVVALPHAAALLDQLGTAVAIIVGKFLPDLEDL
ncbi:MAG: hypothetical protein FJW86_08090 [Actinobacteria bacterium]|nr:hypothetical protein [Actinomycetota bacterium]